MVGCSFFDLLQGQAKAQVKQQLLLALEDEVDSGVRHKLTDTVAQIANHQLESTPWIELGQKVQEWVQNQNVAVSTFLS
jgi:hypothetical protein